MLSPFAIYKIQQLWQIFVRIKTRTKEKLKWGSSVFVFLSNSTKIARLPAKMFFSSYYKYTYKFNYYKLLITRMTTYISVWKKKTKITGGQTTKWILEQLLRDHKKKEIMNKKIYIYAFCSLTYKQTDKLFTKYILSNQTNLYKRIRIIS